MERPQWAPQGIDLTRASAARIYDYYLGGSHNFEVDREAGRQAIEIWPDLPKIMQANRAFMRRAVHHAVSLGVTQFLDIGSGIPTFGNVHEVAREVCAEARVLYVDRDPVAVAHSQALLEDDPLADVVQADLRNPRDIVGAPELKALIDLDRPVALLLVAVLHFVEDADEPHRLVAELRDALPSGSMLILSHATDTRPAQAAQIQNLYRRIGSPLIMRPHETVARFFDGYELEPPGMVFLSQWGVEESAHQAAPEQSSGWVGVGRKP